MSGYTTENPDSRDRPTSLTTDRIAGRDIFCATMVTGIC
jgi:hypothetical protein